MGMTLKTAKKVLVRSPNWVGDAIMATPVVDAIKATNPTCQVHVLAKAWVAPVWEQNPNVDRVIVLGNRKQHGWFGVLKMLFTLRREHFDFAFVLPNSFSSAWIAFWAGCQQRVGYATQQRSWLLTRKIAWDNALQTWSRPKVYLNLVCQAGADASVCEDWKCSLQVTADELDSATVLLGVKGKVLCIGLAPGSVANSRRWPVERYAQLADRFLELGQQVVLVGSPNDQPIAQMVSDHAKQPLLITAGNTNLREGLAVIKHLDLLITNDSGAMHMAYAQGVPVLVLQGAADARVTGPFGSNSHILRAEQITCAPCVKNECPFESLKCMEAISVDQVWEKALSILKSVRVNIP